MMRSPFVGKRFVSLMSPEHAVLSGAKDSVNAVPLFADVNLKSSKFSPIGQPSTLASVSMPSSVPLFIRRGCIMSIHSNSLNDISMKYEWRNVFHNLINYGSLSSSIFHKIESPNQINLLVSPNFNSLFPYFGKNEFNTICNLTLNGTADWNIWGENSIVAYEGNTSLEISPNSPIQLKSFFRKSKPFHSNKFQTVKGRGSVLCSGSGSVYAIRLNEEKDEIIIKSQYLLGVSGSNQNDIENSMTQINMNIKNVPVNPSNLKSQPPVPINKLDAKIVWSYIKQYVLNCNNWILKQYKNYVTGSNDFLKIKGPRDVLIHTAYNVRVPTKPRSTALGNPTVAPDQVLTTESQYDEQKKYTNYVTIGKDGSVDFQSTPNFQESIQQLKKK